MKDGRGATRQCCGGSLVDSELRQLTLDQMETILSMGLLLGKEESKTATHAYVHLQQPGMGRWNNPFWKHL